MSQAPRTKRILGIAILVGVGVLVFGWSVSPTKNYSLHLIYDDIVFGFFLLFRGCCSCFGLIVILGIAVLSFVTYQYVEVENRWTKRAVALTVVIVGVLISCGLTPGILSGFRHLRSVKVGEQVFNLAYHARGLDPSSYELYACDANNQVCKLVYETSSSDDRVFRCAGNMAELDVDETAKTISFMLCDEKLYTHPLG